VDESEFIIEKRYKPMQQRKWLNAYSYLVGSGAYGIVIGCEDLEATQEEYKHVAIKKIERTFEHRFYAKRTLRELKILRNLKHENVRYLYYHFRLSTSSPFNCQSLASHFMICFNCDSLLKIYYHGVVGYGPEESNW
jgi:serine/threonine protein kinase